MKQTITTCDICGQELGRWYEISVSVGAKYGWQNAADMMEIDGVQLISPSPMYGGCMPQKCLCKECMTIMIKAARRMRKNKAVNSPPSPPSS